MATVKCSLSKGLKLGDVYQKEVTLRELSAADIIEASEASEKMVQTMDGPVLIQSPARMGIELLSRQIDHIGAIKSPITTSMLGKLSADDLNILQHHANALDDLVAKEIASRGRDDAVSSGTA